MLSGRINGHNSALFHKEWNLFERYAHKNIAVTQLAGPEVIPVSFREIYPLALHFGLDNRTDEYVLAEQEIPLQVKQFGVLLIGKQQMPDYRCAVERMTP